MMISIRAIAMVIIGGGVDPQVLAAYLGTAG
jgi:hypothetical protein